MLTPNQMTNITLEMNIKLYKNNWETVEDAARLISLLEEQIKRLERIV